MGTGKSKIIIDTFGKLVAEGLCNGLLILCPKSLLTTWERDVFPDHFPKEFLSQTQIVRWGSKKSERYADDLWSKAYPYHVFLVNLEGLREGTARLAESRSLKAVKHFLKGHTTLSVVDESTLIKNPKAKRTKAVLKHVSLQSQYRRILSGLPAPNGPLDLYSQIAFLGSDLLGHSSYYSFKSRYAIQEPIRVAGGRVFNQVVGFRHLEELSQKIQSFSTTLSKEDCLDLPDKMYKNIYITLSPRQKKIYEQMKNEALIQLTNEEQVSAQQVITILLRLQQIASGFIKTDQGSLYLIDDNKESPRLQALESVCRGTERKVLIWTQYLAELNMICSMFEKEFPGESYVTYHGDTSSEKRQKAVEQFQNPKSAVRFFVGQIQAGGRGLTLTEAKTVVFFSNTYNLELRQQAEDRAHRIGQKNNVTYIDLIAEGTIDETVGKSQKLKLDLVKRLMHKEETL